MRQILTALLFVGTLGLLSAQHTSTFSDPTLGNSQVQNGNVGVSYELYSLNDGQIVVPLTLNYTGTRGIKVNEIASRVGLGWNLNVGGYISRVVVGYPDDEHKDEDEKEGILFHDGLRQIQTLDTYTATKETIEGIIEKDFEPDIFTINAPTFSGRFMFDEDNLIVKIDNPNLRITHQQNSQGKLVSFTVIDENGLIYLFNQVSTTTEKTNFQYPDFIVGDAEYEEHTYNSKWHLSRISDTWSNYVDFAYGSETINFMTNKIEKAKVWKKEGNISYPTVVGYDFTGSTEVIQTDKVISSITSSKGETVDFFHLITRNDLSGSKSLYQININGGNITYRTVTGYLGSLSGNNNPRLILDKVVKNNELFLDFTYDSEQLPPRLSYEQDYWGYYNNNSAQTLIPKVYVDQNASDSKSFVDYGYSNFNSSGLIALEGANRKSTLNSEAGILKQIEDKKGAKRIFEYELNQFEYKGKLVTGNGLRIRKITDIASTGTYERIFTYNKTNGNSSGTVIETPKYSYITPWRSIKYIKNDRLYEEVQNIRYRIVGGLQSYINEGSANWSTTEKYDVTTVRFAFPINSVFSEYDVFYSRITEESDLFEGKKVYEYNVPQYYEPLDDAKHRTGVSGSLANGSQSVHENSNPDFGELPYVPSTISMHNITSYPSLIQYKNNSGLTVYEEEYVYSPNNTGVEILGLKYSPLEGSRPVIVLLPQILASPFMIINHLFSKYYIVKNEYNNLSTKTTKEILSNGNYEVSKNYEYYTNNFLRKESWHDSEGDFYEKYFTYPFNYFTIRFSGVTPVGSDAYLMNKLIEYNRNTEPVETVTFRNGKPISGEIYKYKLENGDINLAEIKTFEVQNPTSTSAYNFASINNNDLNVDSRYRSTSFFDHYDEYGNLLQERQAEGRPTSYIYGYNGKYMIAKLENIQYASIPQSLRNNLATTTTESTLISLQNQLRSMFPSGNITTYTYYPHIGKKTETDERGETMYYEYDEFNRLKEVKDLNGKIISKTQYGFKNQ